MSAYMDMTAAELAGCLELARRFPGNTGALSMLDEATLAYGWRYEAIGPAQKAFAAARHTPGPGVPAMNGLKLKARVSFGGGLKSITVTIPGEGGREP